MAFEQIGSEVMCIKRLVQLEKTSLDISNALLHFRDVFWVGKILYEIFSRKAAVKLW